MLRTPASQPSVFGEAGFDYVAPVVSLKVPPRALTTISMQDVGGGERQACTPRFLGGMGEACWTPKRQPPFRHVWCLSALGRHLAGGGNGQCSSPLPVPVAC